jgi:hypothetical protein
MAAAALCRRRTVLSDNALNGRTSMSALMDGMVSGLGIIRKQLVDRYAGRERAWLDGLGAAMVLVACY